MTSLLFVISMLIATPAMADGQPAWVAKTSVRRAISASELVSSFDNWNASCTLQDSAYACRVSDSKGNKFDVMLSDKYRVLSINRE